MHLKRYLVIYTFVISIYYYVLDYISFNIPIRWSSPSNECKNMLGEYNIVLAHNIRLLKIDSFEYIYNCRSATEFKGIC